MTPRYCLVEYTAFFSEEFEHLIFDSENLLLNVTSNGPSDFMEADELQKVIYVDLIGTAGYFVVTKQYQITLINPDAVANSQLSDDLTYALAEFVIE